MKLRCYQQEALDEIWASLCEPSVHPLAILPTGAGKSVIIAALIRKIIIEHPRARVMMLTHRRQLVKQNMDRLIGVTQLPRSRFGIFCSTLNKKQTDKQITYGSIQSVGRSIHKFPAQNLVLIDEAHLVPQKESTTYFRVLERLEEINPKYRRLGLTATPFRSGQGSLLDGDKAWFNDICYDVPMRKLIDWGYLSPLVSKRSNDNSIDVSEIPIVAGDFKKSDLTKKTKEILAEALSQIIAIGNEQRRRTWLLFFPSVSIAKQAAGILNNTGVSSKVITGDTASSERDSIIHSFGIGHIRCICSVDVLTTGFDVKQIDLLGLLRPTKSLSLYIQMVGRASRIAPGKKDALVLDFGGNIERFGPVDAIDIKAQVKKKGKKKGTMPHKFCPMCGCYNAASASECKDPRCGYDFPKVQRGVKQLEKYASDASILSEPLLWDVKHVSVCVSRTGELPVTLVEIHGQKASHIVRVPLAIEHDGWVQRQAIRWIRQHILNQTDEELRIPTRAKDLAPFIREHLPPIAQVIVIKKKKYFEPLEIILEKDI